MTMYGNSIHSFQFSLVGHKIYTYIIYAKQRFKNNILYDNLRWFEDSEKTIRECSVQACLSL